MGPHTEKSLSRQPRKKMLILFAHRSSIKDKPSALQAVLIVACLNSETSQTKADVRTNLLFKSSAAGNGYKGGLHDAFRRVVATLVTLPPASKAAK
jgi:hypothetical protein